MPGRVLRIITRLNQGGPVRQLRGLVPALQAEGWGGPVLHGHLPPNEVDARHELAERGVELVPLVHLHRGIHPLRDPSALVEMRRAIRRAAPDIVHTHLGKAGALGRMAAHSLGIPTVHTWHGHHFDRAGWRGRLARRVERMLSGATQMAIAQSRGQFEDLTRRHKIHQTRRTALIEPGIDMDALGEVLPVSEAGARPLRVLYLGRFAPVKRLDRVLDVASALRRPVQVRLVGGGPEEGPLASQIAARGLGECVRLEGATDDVRGALAWADCLILTSDSEGTPIAVIEALALGCPVLAPDVGGIRDLMERPGCGVLVPPGRTDALVRALERWPVGRVVPAETIDAVRARFAMQRQAAETAALYEALVPVGNRPASPRTSDTMPA